MTTANKLASWASTNLSSGLAQRGYDIVLNIGQSNNINGQGLDTTLDYPMDVIKQLGRLDGYDYKIIQAVEPLHAHTRTTGSKGYVLDFSREYVREGNLLGSREVCIVPGAWGGTGFGGNRWNPGDDLCDDAVDRVNYIINNNEGSRLVAILWHQGESDILYNSNPIYYQIAFNKLIDQFSELSSNKLPAFIAGTILKNKNSDNINNIIRNTNNKRFYNFVELSNLGRNDSVHFTTRSTRTGGKYYFDSYQKLIQENIE